MSQIKELQPKQGVTLLAWLAPEGAYDFKVTTFNFPFQTKLTYFINDKVDMMFLDGHLQLLGIAIEIPEEVWRNIMPEEASINNEVVKIKFLDIKSNKVFNRPKKAAISFLEANEVYSVNPLGQFKPHWSDDIDNWQQAEANTGTWVILMKQND